MKSSMQPKLQHLARRLEDIDAQLAREDAARDMNRLPRRSRRSAPRSSPWSRGFTSIDRAQADLLGAAGDAVRRQT